MTKPKKKRANNEGSLYQRKNGTWRAQVTVGGHRLSYTAKTQKEGLEWNRKKLNQIDAGLSYDNSQITIADFLADWLLSIETAVRPGTLVQYTQIVRDYILPEISGTKLRDLTSKRVQKLYSLYTSKGVGARTVRTIHAVLHRALNYATTSGILFQNPASMVSAPLYQSPERSFFDEHQVRQFLSFAAEKNDRYYALYKLALTTGMRQGELLGLKWSDFDESRGSIHVRRQLKRKKGEGLIFASPKTKSSVRVIVLGSNTSHRLSEHKESLLTDKMVAGDRWIDNNLIFPSTIGTPTIPSKLLLRFKRLVKEAGLPIISFHDLRHTAATLMLNGGVPLMVVSKRLGHSKPSITLDVYGHLITSMQNESAELMDRLTNIENQR